MATIKQMPRSERRIDVSYVKRLGIQSYDGDNLYPQNVQKIVGASSTGSGCLDRLRDFMEGDGLESDALAQLRVNANGERLGDIHALESDDLATFDGFAIHVNYDSDCRIVDCHCVPFENVRLEEPDEDGIVRRVALHPDWTGLSTRAGRRVKVEPDEVDFIDVFNPNPAVVRLQMEKAGGIELYKGQVLYVSTAGHLRYPLAPYDAVLTDMSTDEGMSNLMLRNARNNFLPVGAFVHFKSQGVPAGADEDDTDTEGYSEVIRNLQGDMNSLNLLDIEVETENEVPRFLPFEGKNLDKDFTATDATVKERIYSKFGQEAFLAVRLGKMGFSGTIMQEANDDYARRCVKRQRLLTGAFVDILSHWAAPLPDVANADTLSVRPLTYATKTIEKINE